MQLLARCDGQVKSHPVEGDALSIPNHLHALFTSLLAALAKNVSDLPEADRKAALEYINTWCLTMVAVEDVPRYSLQTQIEAIKTLLVTAAHGTATSHTQALVRWFKGFKERPNHFAPRSGISSCSGCLPADLEATLRSMAGSSSAVQGD
eukprot:NODE_6835_length_814_cov_85.390738_g6599_i0.p1 GENE.NODE_6835_length_814_cov_85.390738_g6599_i0~~NODE_6835_length_814_cov_85.390738_g6599_i0.p1  ORF type:complete len:150 (+),score=19.31 NODE_6835_length_814_cov_85.390738_g6599_i0:290-739(+)